MEMEGFTAWAKYTCCATQRLTLDRELSRVIAKGLWAQGFYAQYTNTEVLLIKGINGTNT